MQMKFYGQSVGEVTELTTNIIAESIYIQCDADGNEQQLLDLLVDYRKDNKAFLLTKQQTNILGRPVIHKNTEDWQICCQQKIGSISQEILPNLKELHPLQRAEFDVTEGIDHVLLLTSELSMCSRKEKLLASEAANKIF